MTCCSFLNCALPGIWKDEDDDRLYCGAHMVYVTPQAEARREVREEIADDLRGERFDADARRSW